jgi:hypothetical protein
MTDLSSRQLAVRPRWMTAMAVFCAVTVVFLIWRDFFDPMASAVEVWGGFEVHGAAARWSAPLHWGIFAVGAWAFWTVRPWAVTAAALYAFYIALSHLVWSEASPKGQGWPMGLLQAAGFSIPGFLLLRARRRL